jgi:hypothetical protein
MKEIRVQIFRNRAWHDDQFPSIRAGEKFRYVPCDESNGKFTGDEIPYHQVLVAQCDAYVVDEESGQWAINAEFALPACSFSIN